MRNRGLRSWMRIEANSHQLGSIDHSMRIISTLERREERTLHGMSYLPCNSLCSKQNLPLPAMFDCNSRGKNRSCIMHPETNSRAFITANLPKASFLLQSHILSSPDDSLFYEKLEEQIHKTFSLYTDPVGTQCNITYKPYSNSKH